VILREYLENAMERGSEVEGTGKGLADFEQRRETP
jgi:hypothetical protein